MGKPASRLPASPSGAGSERKQLVRRSCRVCEWEGDVIEQPGADVECPWCHAPTEPTDLPPVMIEQAADRSAKNPYASALGRLGGLKGGRARAEVLTPKQRRAIARKAARARWRKAAVGTR